MEWTPLALLAILCGVCWADVTLTGNARVTTGQRVSANAWGVQNAWGYEGLNKYSLPSRVRYPFLRWVELFTATGGCYKGFPGCQAQRDLFRNPADPKSGVDASPLIKGLTEVINAGFLPYIVTGNVRIASITPLVPSAHVHIHV